jgi:hypothetical protein
VLVVLAFAVAAVALSWLYFRRFQVARPPIGAFNLTDVAFIMAGIILVPYLYLLLPLWLVAGLLVLGALSVLYFLWEPVLRARALVWLVTIALIGADLWAALQFGTTGNAFFIVNNIVLLAMVVGLSNLWAQSGMRSRDVVILGGFLIFYDLTATWLLPLMDDMMLRLAGLPFSPMVAWAVGTGAGSAVSIGLGDLLLASVFPLVMRKAFGRAAGRAAMLVALGAIAALMLVPIATTFPVMIVLGPLMVVQYAYWSRRHGRERTTRQYLQAEPLKATSVS